ncbi:hypothetical protein ANO14919_068360 [Xylariales sp. No.14919]|nr:hypothetical protein ANO14919_068360 [Xylariales sp. No.14919]
MRRRGDDSEVREAPERRDSDIQERDSEQPSPTNQGSQSSKTARPPLTPSVFAQLQASVVLTDPGEASGIVPRSKKSRKVKKPTNTGR